MILRFFLIKSTHAVSFVKELVPCNFLPVYRFYGRVETITVDSDIDFSLRKIVIREEIG